MKKILIVTCRFDEDRNGGSRPWRVPQAMAAAYLAGGFNPQKILNPAHGSGRISSSPFYIKSSDKF